jgi:hypothetical protein
MEMEVSFVNTIVKFSYCIYLLPNLCHTLQDGYSI